LKAFLKTLIFPFNLFILPPLIIGGLTFYLTKNINLSLSIVGILLILWPLYLRLQRNNPLLDSLFPATMNYLADMLDWGRTSAQAEQRGCILAPHTHMCIHVNCQAWHIKTQPLNYLMLYRGSCRIWPRGAPGVHGKWSPPKLPQ
jgi:hypothetical protein